MVVPFLRLVRTRRDITRDTGGCCLTFCCFPLLCQRTKKKTLFLQLEPVLLSTFSKRMNHIQTPSLPFCNKTKNFQIFSRVYTASPSKKSERQLMIFTTVCVIGRGGSKVTYRGFLLRLNKMVAVKLFINNAMYREELQIARNTIMVHGASIVFY